jgi:hypothetical protein
MNKTYEVIFGTDALPGVFAIGSIRRGQSAMVDAAEAVRLVDVKGLAFATADSEAEARAELAASTPPLPSNPNLEEEH